MSHITPAAPPPPPPLPPARPMTKNLAQTNADADIHKDTAADNIKSVPNDACSWAWEYPELRKGCYLGRVCQYDAPKQCQYYAVASILQVGPTCGLTALSMLLNGKTTAAQLYTEATMKEYTFNGEMFSAQYLYELTRMQLSLHTPGACQMHEGHLNCAKVKNLLLAGGCLLVPYPFLKFIGV